MKLALELPWSNTAGRTPIHPSANPAGKNFPAEVGFQLSDVINSFADVALFVGGFLMFFWAAWGVFDYIRAEGNKEALAKARKRIQWAIVGFIILIMAFLISDVLNLLLTGGVNRAVTPIIVPGVP